MEVIETPKKIKVTVSKKIGAIYGEDGTKYLPGDIIEIPEKSFRPDHYDKIEPPKPKAEPVQEETVEPPTTEKPATEEKAEEPAIPTMPAGTPTASTPEITEETAAAKAKAPIKKKDPKK